MKDHFEQTVTWMLSHRAGDFNLAQQACQCLLFVLSKLGAQWYGILCCSSDLKHLSPIMGPKL